MRYTLLGLLLLVGSACFAQPKQKKQAPRTTEISMAFPDSALALNDIKQNNIQLYCGGGIAPRALSSQDKSFERQFLVKYHILGCTMPPRDGLRAYNQVIACYLDKKYGTTWRFRLRQDVYL